MAFWSWAIVFGPYCNKNSPGETTATRSAVPARELVSASLSGVFGAAGVAIEL